MNTPPQTETLTRSGCVDVLDDLEVGVDDPEAREVHLALGDGPVVREGIRRVLETGNLQNLHDALSYDILHPKLTACKVLHFATPLTMEGSVCG